MKYKYCPQCKQTKPIHEFYRSKSKKSGFVSWCKDCYRASSKRRVAEQPEKERERHQKWYAKKSKEYHNEQTKKYRKAHPGYDAQRVKKYRQKNPVQAANASRKYVSTHRRQVYDLQRARRQRLRSNGGSFSVHEWLELCDKYGNKCLACGLKKPLSADHVVPVSKGGIGTIDNIQPLCNSCNSKKKDRIVDYRK